MAAGTHLHEIFVRAPLERVWEALTDPVTTPAYLFGHAFRHGAEPGPYRLVDLDSGEVVVDGEIEVYDPHHRLVMTWRVLDDTAMFGEPPGRVEWTLTPADDRASITRLTLRHGELALSPLTHARMGPRWLAVVSSLKSLLETGAPLPTVDIAADGVTADDPEAQWHRLQAVTANNSVWELLDGRELAPADVDELLARAYASAYHWKRARGATVVNDARAAYLLSRVHATCGHGELALHHADRCSELVGSIPDEADDFDHAYANEARARALACLGRRAEALEARRRAASVSIADEQDRAIFASDLSAGPWFCLDG